ncbi:bombesin receptor subtype-3-like [Saccostrea cucullata]|uniref:bombesin receptor subtype-3-like n=1 Tax=Saccostrea cuccullata TaxID=36930 RepID=UPI002ED4CAAD
MDKTFQYSLVKHYEFLSKQHSEKLLPNTIVQMIGAVFGIFGNSLVLWLYGKYIRDKSGSRYFIPALAFVDLVGCVLNAIHFHLENIMSYNYPGVHLCKTMYFLILFTGGFSAILILAIALQRYLLICRPFGRQMTKKLCKISLLFMLLISLGPSVPSLKLIGQELKLNEFNISEEIVFCKAGNFSTEEVQEMISYLGVLLFFTLGNICVTSDLYIPVIRAMYRTLSPPRQNNGNYGHHVNPAERRISDDENIAMEELPETDVRHNNIEHCNNAITVRNRKLKARQRITLMFLVIIIVYVVTYLTTPRLPKSTVL